MKTLLIIILNYILYLFKNFAILIEIKRLIQLVIRIK